MTTYVLISFVSYLDIPLLALAAVEKQREEDGLKYEEEIQSQCTYLGSIHMWRDTVGEPASLEGYSGRNCITGGIQWEKLHHF